MRKKHAQSAGFTLIEVIIYIALFGIIMGGLITTAYQLTQSTSHLESKGTTQEEINFVLKKIDWALTGAKSSSVVITSSKITFSKTGYPATIINLSPSNDIQMTLNGVVNTLTTQNVKVTSLQFTYDLTTKIVTGNFTIDGIPVNFTKYLKI